jgi:archaellum component FlaC
MLSSSSFRSVRLHQADRDGSGAAAVARLSRWNVLPRLGAVSARRQEADAMATPTLLNRLDILEVKVNALEALPARIDALTVQIGEQREALERAVSALRGQITSCRDELREQITGVREELREEITGVREELREQITGVRDELREQIAGVREELREQIAGVREELREEIAGAREDLRQELRQEITGVRDELRAQTAATHALMHSLIAGTRTHMLVLHEEVLERIKLIGEAGPARKGPPRRRH